MFTIHDAGCYADGAFGRGNAREVLARLLEGMFRHHPRGGDGIHWKSEVEQIVNELRGEPSDDLSEEDDAIDKLNSVCEEGCHFEFVDGDLMLLDDTEEDDEL